MYPPVIVDEIMYPPVIVDEIMYPPVIVDEIMYLLPTIQVPAKRGAISEAWGMEATHVTTTLVSFMQNPPF